MGINYHTPANLQRVILPLRIQKEEKLSYIQKHINHLKLFRFDESLENCDFWCYVLSAGVQQRCKKKFSLKFRNLVEWKIRKLLKTIELLT